MVFRKVFLIIGIALHLNSIAQTAIIDSEKVFSSIPEIAKLDTLFKKESDKYFKEYQEIQLASEKQFILADSLYKHTPKEENSLKAVAESQKLHLEVQNYPKKANEKLNEYKELLYKPYLEKIDNAVKLVATRRKYMQVMDIQKVPMVYFNPTSDITEDVIKELKGNGTNKQSSTKL